MILAAFVALCFIGGFAALAYTQWRGRRAFEAASADPDMTPRDSMTRSEYVGRLIVALVSSFVVVAYAVYLHDIHFASVYFRFDTSTEIQLRAVLALLPLLAFAAFANTAFLNAATGLMLGAMRGAALGGDMPPIQGMRWVIGVLLFTVITTAALLVT